MEGHAHIQYSIFPHLNKLLLHLKQIYQDTMSKPLFFHQLGVCLSRQPCFGSLTYKPHIWRPYWTRKMSHLMSSWRRKMSCRSARPRTGGLCVVDFNNSALHLSTFIFSWVAGVDTNSFFLSNCRLLLFLCQDQCMQELVRMITTEPPGGVEETKRFK